MKMELPLDSKLTKNVVRFVNNGQVVLISSSSLDEAIKNVFSLSWMTPVSYRPLLFLISVTKGKISHDLIKESKEFVINVPTVALKETVLQAGTLHGDKGDKIEKLELTPMKAKTVKAPLITECILNIECKVVREFDVEEDTMFLGEASAICYDEGVITEKGFNEKYKDKNIFVHYIDVRGERV